jgi:hypothetical protein
MRQVPVSAGVFESLCASVCVSIVRLCICVLSVSVYVCCQFVCVHPYLLSVSVC